MHTSCGTPIRLSVKMSRFSFTAVEQVSTWAASICGFSTLSYTAIQSVSALFAITRGLFLSKKLLESSGLSSFRKLMSERKLFKSRSQLAALVTVLDFIEMLMYPWGENRQTFPRLLLSHFREIHCL